MDLVGRMLGQYQIIEELGRGGMAVVYKAHQPSLNRYVAIKVLPPQFAFDEQFVQRFLREARGAAALHHPNIVTIHDINQQDGIYFIVMEYAKGETLDQLIARSGALPLQRVVRIVSQMADALEHAHQQGLIHRDVKPSNIIIDEQRSDHVTLMDFGLVRAAEGTGLTRTGTIVGTPEYMSPEQAEGEQVDSRTDIYSLGVVIFKMLTGNVPFSRSTPHAVLIAHITQEPPSITSMSPSLPPAVEAVVRRALAKDREARYARASDLARDLATAATGKMPTGLEVAPKVKERAKVPVARKPAAKPRGKGRIWGLAAVGAILLFAACGAVAAFVLGIASPSTPASPTPSYTPTEVEAIEMTSTPKPTSTPTKAPTPTAILTPTPKPTPPPTKAPTTTAAPSLTPSPTATATPIPRPVTPTPTHTPQPVCSIDLIGPEDAIQLNAQEITFHWTGAEPQGGEYYEVRVDGRSTGAAWYNSGLQRWEAIWKASGVGGHTWQAFLMAPDQQTVRCSSPVRSFTLTAGEPGGEGPAPEPTRD